MAPNVAAWLCLLLPVARLPPAEPDRPEGGANY